MTLQCQQAATVIHSGSKQATFHHIHWFTSWKNTFHRRHRQEAIARSVQVTTKILQNCQRLIATHYCINRATLTRTTHNTAAEARVVISCCWLNHTSWVLRFWWEMKASGVSALSFSVHHIHHSPIYARCRNAANGNLQRLFSSYYDAPVHVVVDKCNQDSKHTWNRLVHLTVHDQKFCTAQSRITVHDDECCRLVESQRVGLGQLFRHLDKLPSFNLLDAGYSEQGGLWRVYELECRELTCHIEETFAPDMWNIQKL